MTLSRDQYETATRCLAIAWGYANAHAYTIAVNYIETILRTKGPR
jgi:hypothetical protein